MYIIENDILIQVDSMLDVIEHSGKKGMKWGHRAAKAVGSGIRYGVNNQIHPFLSARAHAESLVKAGSFRKHILDSNLHPIKYAQNHNAIVKKYQNTNKLNKAIKTADKYKKKESKLLKKQSNGKQLTSKDIAKRQTAAIDRHNTALDVKMRKEIKKNPNQAKTIKRKYMGMNRVE